MKNFKNYIFLIFISLIIFSGFLFANRKIKPEVKPSQQNSVDKKSSSEAKKKWDASPDGIKFNEWKASPKGKKVQASYEKIKNSINNFTEMEALVTSVTFQRENVKSSSPKWLIVKIKGEYYMMQFSQKDFQNLNSLKVNDKIVVKSRSAGLSHNHPFLILSGDYIAKDNKVLFKRDFSKNTGC